MAFASALPVPALAGRWNGLAAAQQLEQLRGRVLAPDLLQPLEGNGEFGVPSRRVAGLALRRAAHPLHRALGLALLLRGGGGLAHVAECVLLFGPAGLLRLLPAPAARGTGIVLLAGLGRGSLLLLLLLLRRRLLFRRLLEQLLELGPQPGPVRGPGVHARAQFHGRERVAHGPLRHLLLGGEQVLAPVDGLAAELRPVGGAALLPGGQSADDLGQRRRRIHRAVGACAGRAEQEGRGQRCRRRGAPRRGPGNRRDAEADIPRLRPDGELDAEACKEADERLGQRPLVALDEPHGVVLDKAALAPRLDRGGENLGQVHPPAGVGVDAVGGARQLAQRVALEPGEDDRAVLVLHEAAGSVRYHAAALGADTQGDHPYPALGKLADGIAPVVVGGPAVAQDDEEAVGRRTPAERLGRGAEQL